MAPMAQRRARARRFQVETLERRNMTSDIGFIPQLSVNPPGGGNGTFHPIPQPAVDAVALHAAAASGGVVTVVT